jgi:hypothetical protein
VKRHAAACGGPLKHPVGHAGMQMHMLVERRAKGLWRKSATARLRRSATPKNLGFFGFCLRELSFTSIRGQGSWMAFSTESSSQAQLTDGKTVAGLAWAGLSFRSWDIVRKIFVVPLARRMPPMTLEVAHTAEEIFRRRVAAARSLKPGEKFLAGPRLFERACGLALAGLRHRHPEADEATIRGLLHRQVAALRRLDAGR